MAGASTLTGNVFRLGLGALGLGHALGALAVAQGAGRYTTYAGQSQVVATLAALSGLALIAAGVTTAVVRPVAARLGDLAILAGFVWFAPFWIGWEGGPPIVRSLGTVTAGFLVPLLLHVALACREGRPASGPARLLVGLVYAEAAFVAVGRAALYEPFADPTCWANCADNVFLVASRPDVAEMIHRFDLGFDAVATIAVVAIVGLEPGRRAASTPSVRHGSWSVLPAVGVLATATVLRSLELARTAVENPAVPALGVAFVILCAAALLLAGALGYGVHRAGARRRAMTRVLADLDRAPRPGTLRSALARAVGDPELAIAYRLVGQSGYADEHGRSIDEPVATRGRSVTPLVRAGQPVALITHTVTTTELERGLGPAIRLAVENEVLRVQLLAQVDDLRSSQARIVAAGDAGRRRLERDLHDGAQQHLVALTYGLRLAQAQAAGEVSPTVEVKLGRAMQDAQAALDELRELASGIFPVLLAESGLAPAIAALAEAASIPVEIGECTQQRYPEAVESAGYLVVATAVDGATRAGASYAAVTGVAAGYGLVITVQDDGADPGSPMADLLDRVGALGGTVQRRDGALRAEIPCA